MYVKCVPAERMHNLFTYSLYTFTSTCITTTIRAKTPWQGTETQAGCGWMAASKHRDISGWTAPDTAHARPISGHMASGSPTHSGGGVDAHFCHHESCPLSAASPAGACTKRPHSIGQLTSGFHFKGRPRPAAACRDRRSSKQTPHVSLN